MFYTRLSACNNIQSRKKTCRILVRVCTSVRVTCFVACTQWPHNCWTVDARWTRKPVVSHAVYQLRMVSVCDFLALVYAMLLPPTYPRNDVYRINEKGQKGKEEKLIFRAVNMWHVPSRLSCWLCCCCCCRRPQTHCWRTSCQLCSQTALLGQSTRSSQQLLTETTNSGAGAALRLDGRLR